MAAIYSVIGAIFFWILVGIVGIFVLGLLSWIGAHIYHTPRFIERRKEKVKKMVKSVNDNGAIAFQELLPLYKLMRSLNLMRCERCAHYKGTILEGSCYPVPGNYHTCEIKIWSDFFDILDKYLNSKEKPSTEAFWNALATLKKIIS